MNFNKELSDIVDPILRADTEDWWELAAVAQLNAAELEEEIGLSPENEQPELSTCLREYREKLLTEILRQLGHIPANKDQLCSLFWNLEIVPRDEFSNQVREFLLSQGKSHETALVHTDAVKISKSETQQEELPRILKEIGNYLPHIIDIHFEPLPCRNSLFNGGTSSYTEFTIYFKTHREYFGKHLVVLGLKSGKLQLSISPRKAATLHPQSQLAPRVDIVESTTVGKHVEEMTKTTKVSVSRVSVGGTTAAPYWFFESGTNDLLEGRAELSCFIRSEADTPYRLRYEFVVQEGDWSFDIHLHPQVRPLAAVIAKLKLRKFCAERTAILNSYVVNLRNVISQGEWECPAQEKTLALLESKGILGEIETSRGDWQEVIKVIQSLPSEIVNGFLGFSEAEQSYLISVLLQGATVEPALHEKLRRWRQLSHESRAEALENLYRAL